MRLSVGTVSFLLLLGIISFSAIVFAHFHINLYGTLIFFIVTILSLYLRITFITSSHNKSLHRDMHWSLTFLCFYFFGPASALVNAYLYAIILGILRWKVLPSQYRVHVSILNGFMSVLALIVLFPVFFQDLDEMRSLSLDVDLLFYLKLIGTCVATEFLQLIAVLYHRKLIGLIEIDSIRSFINQIHLNRYSLLQSWIEATILLYSFTAIRHFILSSSIWGVAFIFFLTYILIRYLIHSSEVASYSQLQKKQVTEQNHTLLGLNKQIQRANKQVLMSLAVTLEMKDVYTAGHSRRVAYYAYLLGKEIGYSKNELRVLYYGGLVHDIGKIAIREEVLKKPSRITNEEFEEIKRHPTKGSEMIDKYLYYMNENDRKKIYEITRHHHERFDGKGYPDGLKGDQIPPMAQLLSVVDAFDAMTSARSYRAAFGFEQALEEIIQHAGSQFSPQMVSAFYFVFNKRLTPEWKQKRTDMPILEAGV